MRPRLFHAAAFAALLAIAGSCSSGSDRVTAPEAAAKPATSSTPPTPSAGQSADPTETAEQIETMNRLRTRGWQMFHALATSTPSFLESGEWHHEGRAFARPQATSPETPGIRFGVPEELLEPGTVRVFDANEEFKIYESTYYNTAGVQHVRRAHLYDPLTSLVLLGEKRREIDEFPQGTKVLKTFWRPIPVRGCAKVGVWKWKLPHDPARIPEARWHERTEIPPINVTADGEPRPGCIEASTAFITARVIDPDVFECGTCQQELQQGQTMLLVGVHIISKELPDWFWSTFWWQGVGRTDGTTVGADGMPKTASWTCDTAQRPHALSRDQLAEKLKPWSNYSMDVIASFNVPKPPVAMEDVPLCGEPGVLGNHEELFAAYNPFVEGVRINGRKSSCLDCHGRARTEQGYNGNIPPVSTPDRYPGLRDFEGYIRTDYLWTVKHHLAATPK